MKNTTLTLTAYSVSSQESTSLRTSYTFQSKVTKLDKPIGKDVPAFIYEKSTGQLIYQTCTDEDSNIYIPNLDKTLKYFVVVSDYEDIYNSVIFDLNWDFAESSGTNFNLKYYKKYTKGVSNDLYKYPTSIDNPLYEPSLVFNISVPNRQEDQEFNWGLSGSVNADHCDDISCFLYKGSTSEYSYINASPSLSEKPFTFECFFKPLKLPSGTYLEGYIFHQIKNNLLQCLYIDSEGYLYFKKDAIIEATTALTMISTVKIVDDRLNHLALTYDGYSFRLFLNGVNVAEKESKDGLSYVNAVFKLGYNFYGFIGQPSFFKTCKYVSNFDPDYNVKTYSPVFYVDDDDEYANKTVIKTYIDPSKRNKTLEDIATNTVFAGDYTVSSNSILCLNNTFVTTIAPYTKLALTKDFTVRIKARILSRLSANPVLFSNKSTAAGWTTGDWQLHADYPDGEYKGKFVLSVNGTNSSGRASNLPCLYHEPFEFTLTRQGNTITYYINGTKDKSFNHTTNFETKALSFIGLGNGLNFEVYEMEVLNGVVKFTNNYSPTLLTSERLIDSYYRILNLDFKSSFIDSRSRLLLVNNGVLLSDSYSTFGTNSAYFDGNSYLITTTPLFYIPSEDFTIEFKFLVERLPGSLITEEEGVEVSTELVQPLFSLFTDVAEDFNLFLRKDSLYFKDATAETELLKAEDIVLKEFNHIVLQRSGATLKILHNGFLIKTLNVATNFTAYKTLLIGSNKSLDSFFEGYINSFNIYKMFIKYTDEYEVPVDPYEGEDLTSVSVKVLDETTVALDFENGTVDKIQNTEWSLTGNALVSVNKLYGTKSLETFESPRGGLYTTDPIISGNGNPWSLSFSFLLKSFNNGATDQSSVLSRAIPLFSKNDNKTKGQFGISVINKRLALDTRSVTNNDSYTSGSTLLELNTIYRVNLEFDGAVIRVFLNGYFEFSYGLSVGWLVNNSEPYCLGNSVLSSYPSLSAGSSAIIDNINVHDKYVELYRDTPDPYAEYLLLDLSFNGQEGSKVLKDNGSAQSVWTANGSGYITASDKYTGYSSWYTPDGTSQNAYSTSSSLKVGTDAFTLEMVFKPTVLSTGVFYVLYANSNNQANKIIAYIYNGNIGTTIDGLAVSTSFPTNDYLNKWVKYTIIKTDNEFSVYLNGVLKNTTPLTTVFDIDFVKYGGLAFGYSGWSLRDPIVGYVDSFKIYKGLAKVPTPLEYETNLEFLANGAVSDKSLAVWSPSSLNTTYEETHKGYSGTFNGETFILSSSSNLNLGTNNFKIEFNSKSKNRNEQNMFSNTVTNGSTTGAVWFYKGSPANNFSYLNYNGRSTNATNMTLLNNDYDNIWYNEKVFRVKDTLYQVKNDVIQSVETLDNNPSFNLIQGGYFKLGASNWGYPFKGVLNNFETKRFSKLDVDILHPLLKLPLKTDNQNKGTQLITPRAIGTPVFTTIGDRNCYSCSTSHYYILDQNSNFLNVKSDDFYLEFKLYLSQYNNSAWTMVMGNGTAYTNAGGIFIGVSPSNEGSIQGNKFGFHTVSETGVQQQYRTVNDFPINQWNTLGISRKGNILTLYMNGVEERVSPIIENSIVNFGHNGFYVGKYTSFPTGGYLADVTLWRGVSKAPSTYDENKEFELTFEPTYKAYLFKDNLKKSIIHPVNITERYYEDGRYCCKFNGTNQYIMTGYSSAFNINKEDFALGFKVKIESFNNSYQYILASGGADSAFGSRPLIRIVGTQASEGSPRTLEIGDTTSVWLTVTGLTLGENEVTIYRKGQVLSVLLNGERVANITGFNKSINFNLNNNTFICKSPWDTASFFKGILYYVKLVKDTDNYTLVRDHSPYPYQRLPTVDTSLRNYTVRFNFDYSLVDAVSGSSLSVPPYQSAPSYSVNGVYFDGATSKKTLLVPYDLRDKFNLTADFTINFDLLLTAPGLIISAQTTGIKTVALGTYKTDDSTYYLALQDSATSSDSIWFSTSTPMLKFGEKVNIKYVKSGNIIRVYVNNYFVNEKQWSHGVNFNVYTKPLIGGYTEGGNSVPTGYLDNLFICKDYVEFFHTIKNPNYS